MAEPHGPAEVPGWHHVPLPYAGMRLAKLNVLQAERYPGFVTGFKHIGREENTLRVFFFKGELLQKA